MTLRTRTQEQTEEMDQRLNACEMQCSMDQNAATNARQSLNTAIESERVAEARLAEARGTRSGQCEPQLV